MSAKDRHRAKLLDYLSDPTNPFLPRIDLATKVLGFRVPESIYKPFSPAELFEIEAIAFEERKKRTVRERAEVYHSLYIEAKAGNVAAAKEYLDRVEGKVETPIKSSGELNLKISHEEALDELE